MGVSLVEAAPEPMPGDENCLEPPDLAKSAVPRRVIAAGHDKSGRKRKSHRLRDSYRQPIAANLSKSIRLVDIARACELSLGYFSRAFKASTGFTPHGWLQACRVEQAKVLLRDSRLSLAEVAQACGFADQSHFTKIFTRAARSGPGAWRFLHRLR